MLSFPYSQECQAVFSKVLNKSFHMGNLLSGLRCCREMSLTCLDLSVNYTYTHVGFREYDYIRHTGSEHSLPYFE